MARKLPHRRREFGDPLRERRAFVPERPVVVAFDRDRQPVAVFGELFARRFGGEQPVEAARFAGEEAAVAVVEAEVGARRQRPRLEQEADQALGRAALAVEGADDAGEPRHRVAGAGRRVAAGEAQAVQPGGQQRPVVGVVAGIGGVEDQAAQRARVADRVGLAEERPVGVAVEEDLAEAEGAADLVHVVGGFARGVAGEARAELVGALADRDRFLDQPRLQGRAVDRVGEAGAAHVVEDEVAAAEDRPERGDQRAGVGLRRRGVARAAVHGEDRPQARLPEVAAMADREGDLGLAERRVAAADRDHDVAALERSRHAEVAAVELGTRRRRFGGRGRAGPGDDERGAEGREDDPEPCAGSRRSASDRRPTLHGSQPRRSRRKGRGRLGHGPGRLWPWPRRPGVRGEVTGSGVFRRGRSA